MSKTALATAARVASGDMSMRRNFNDATRRDVLEALAAGHMLETAAALAGVQFQTMKRWLVQGARHLHEGRDGDFADFAREVQRMQAGAVGELWVAVIEAARNGDVKAAQWALSKHWPQRFGDKLSIEQTVDVKPDVPVDIDEARARWEAIGRRNGWLE